MKLEDALKKVASGAEGYENRFVDSAKKFLYGKGKPEHGVTPSAAAVLAGARLSGNNFSPLQFGNNTLVFGNNEDVFKLSSEECNFYQDSSTLPIKDIPAGLAAKVHYHGTCNGIKFHVCERLSSARPELKEIVAFLFKARGEKGKEVIYWDPKPSNFGYDKEGVLKVIDHEHFKDAQKASTAEFTSALHVALRACEAGYPRSFSGPRETFVLLNAEEEPSPDTSLFSALQQALHAKGISDDHIHRLKSDPSVVMIDSSSLTRGNNKAMEAFDSYLTESLSHAAAINKPKIPERFISNSPSVADAKLFIASLSHLLKSVDPKSNELITTLPDAMQLAGMKKDEVAALFGKLMRNSKSMAIAPDRLDTLELVADTYLRRYSAKTTATQR